MIIPKSKRKQRKLFIELRYLENTGFEDIKRLITKNDIKSLVSAVGLLTHRPRAINKKLAFSCGLVTYSQGVGLLLEQLNDKVFKGNGEYPHPPTVEESKSLWLDTLPEEIRLDLSSAEDKEWDATYQAAYGTRPALSFAPDSFHDSLEDEGYDIDYGDPVKQDFEFEEDYDVSVNENSY